MADGVQIIWTPWRNHDEILRVRGWLFASSPEETIDSGLRKKACGQISAWKLRGNLPHAVESTWLLTEAVLTDGIQDNTVSSFAVKAAYITAISRFVTGLLDSQQDGKFKVSMYAKAQQVGLPAVFVDLRHEATHGDIPSLQNLRSAAQRALRWLWDDYWKELGERDAFKQSQESITPSSDLAIQPATELEHGDLDICRNEEVEAPSLKFERAGWQKWQGMWDSRPIGT